MVCMHSLSVCFFTMITWYQNEFDTHLIIFLLESPEPTHAARSKSIEYLLLQVKKESLRGRL